MLDRALASAEAGELEQAQLTFQLWLTTYPRSDLRDQAYFGLGRVNRRLKDYTGAVRSFQKLIDEVPESPRIGPAQHELSGIYVEQGEYDKALPILKRERSLSTEPADRQALTEQIIDLYLRKNDHVQAIAELLKKEGGGEGGQETVEERLEGLLKESDLQELNDLVQKFPKSFPGDRALMQLAERYETAGEYFEADRELRRFLSAYPRHRDVPQVRNRITGIKQRVLAHRHLLGAMLPLSGRLKPFGQEVLNGIRLALDPSSAPRPEDFVEIVVWDSGSDGSALPSGMDELIREYRVRAVIGPLLTREVSRVAAKAEQHRVPLIAPAASRELERNWTYVVRTGVTLGAQAIQIARYAKLTLGLKRFCILYPEDEYGKEMMRNFREEVEKQGGEVIAWASYDPQATDFGGPIRHLKSVDATKYGFLGPPPSQRGQVREYLPGFDAVFIPGDYDQAGLIAAQLAFYDIQGVTLLGAGGWNSADLIRIGGRFMEGGIFVDGFFAESPDPAVQFFVEQYRQRYQREPSLLAAQAYDATRILLKALEEGAESGEAILEFLHRVTDFPGATGRLSSTAAGEISRPLVFIQVRNGKFVQIGAGFAPPG